MGFVTNTPSVGFATNLAPTAAVLVVAILTVVAPATAIIVAAAPALVAVIVAVVPVVRPGHAGDPHRRRRGAIGPVVGAAVDNDVVAAVGKAQLMPAASGKHQPRRHHGHQNNGLAQEGSLC